MSQPRFSHVIFDMDGTILSTLDDLASACNYVCESHGWPTFSKDQYRYKVGNGQPKLIERIIPAEYFGNGAVFEQALNEFRTYYAAHREDNTAPYEGINKMLHALKEAGVELAVLSNKDHAATAALGEQYFAGLFKVVQGRVDAYPPKPETPITLHVLDELGAVPETSLYVGDSNVDVACGHNAGMQVCGVSWGFRGRAELEAAGAEYVIDTPSELLDLVLS